MENFTLTDAMLAKGGLTVVAGWLIIWLLQKLINKLFKDDSDKSELLTKEREELKQEKQEFKDSITELRAEINALHIYIRTEHKDTIEKNSTAYDNMCESHKQLCLVIADLSENMKKRRASDK